MTLCSSIGPHLWIRIQAQGHGTTLDGSVHLEVSQWLRDKCLAHDLGFGKEYFEEMEA